MLGGGGKKYGAISLDYHCIIQDGECTVNFRRRSEFFQRKHVALIIHFVRRETRVDMGLPARGCDRRCVTEVVAVVLCTRCRAEHILMIDLSKPYDTLRARACVCVLPSVHVCALLLYLLDGGEQ